MSKKLFGIFVVLVFAVGLFGCGGRGGVGPTQQPAPLDPIQQPALITNAISGETVGAITNIAGDLSGMAMGMAMGFSGNVSGTPTHPQKLRKQKLSRTVKPLIGPKAMVWTPFCDTGFVTKVGVQSADKRTITITTTYNSCTEKWGGDYHTGQCTTTNPCTYITWTGKIVGKYTNPNWTTTISDPANPPDVFIEGISKIEGTYDNWENEHKNISGNIIDWHDIETINGSIVINIESDEKFSFTCNIAFKGKDVLEDYEETTTFTNFGVLAEMITENNNEVEKTTVNGTVTHTGTDEPTESISFSNYVEKMWYATNPNGYKSTIDGGMTLNLSCLKGKITIATEQVIFTPQYEYCPTSGKVKISGSGTATIEYTSTGGAKVYVGDTLAKTATNCGDLRACHEIGKVKISKGKCRWNKSNPTN